MEIYISLMVIIGLIIFLCLVIIRDNAKKIESTLTDKPDLSRFGNNNSFKD